MIKKLIPIILVIVLLFSACESSDDTVPSPSATQAPATTSIPTAAPTPSPSPTPYNGPTNPLTGLPVETDISGMRPLAIMLNNIHEALPQHGISSADIIYEALAEGGITRMLAVYQDITGVGRIGSIRSARAYYLDLAQGHDAIFIHAGGSPQAYDEIYNRGVTSIDGVNGIDDIFYRDPERLKNVAYEHTLFSTDELINKYFPTYHIRRDHDHGYSYSMTFSDDGTPIDGVNASLIKAKFSDYKTGVFEYDLKSGLYLVSQYGDKMVDGDTDEQVGVTNVLVIYTSVGDLSNDTSGRLSVDLVGSGNGIFACGGKYIPITWTKDSYSSQFKYTLEDGTELVFGRGRTYVNIIPLYNDVTIS